MRRAVPTAVPLYREPVEQADGIGDDDPMAYNELFAPGFAGQPYEGASERISLFCEPDEAITALLHGVLRREQTPASGGERCDWFVTGDREGSMRTAPRQAFA